MGETPEHETPKPAPETVGHTSSAPTPAVGAGNVGPEAPAKPSLGLAILLRVAQVIATVFVLLYFLFDDLVLAWLRPLFAYLGRQRLFVRLTLWMRRRPPYQALLLFAVPFIVLEPFKFGGLVLVGTGHMISGPIMLAASHLLSLLIVERIFHVTREQLLTIVWFAWGFHLVMRIKDWAFDRLKASVVWRLGVAIADRVRSATRPATRLVGRTVRAVAAAWRRLTLRARTARD